MGCGGSKDTQTSSQSQPKAAEKKDERPEVSAGMRKLSFVKFLEALIFR